MADGSKIEWTEATWNPIRGCTRISEGCRNCYAEHEAARQVRYARGRGIPEGKGPYDGLVRLSAQGEPRWTGVIRTVPERLNDPLRWQRPRRIFVNSMSDLFHEDLSAIEIDKVVWVMENAQHHVFQVLTKRASRMREYLTRRYAYDAGSPKPPTNVWWGVSVEDDDVQRRHRIAELRRSPAAVRWISYEPAIGKPTGWLDEIPPRLCRTCLNRWEAPAGLCVSTNGTPNPAHRACAGSIDWVVVGGESGQGARPFDLGWAREVIRVCAQRQVAVFVKQMGAVPVALRRETDGSIKTSPGGDPWPAYPVTAIRHPKGAIMDEWPEDLRVRQYPVGVP